MQKKRHPLIVIVTLISIVLLMFLSEQKNKTDQAKSDMTVAENGPASPVETYLSQMTLEEKIGQLFFSRVPENGQIDDLMTYHLGGYLLFSRDIEGQTLNSLKETIANYQTASKWPLLIGSDEEGGSVTRLSQILEIPFSSPQDIYNQSGLEGVINDTKLKAQTLRSVGIHTGLFPLADIAQNNQSFIYDRTLGQDLETTTTYVSEVVKALNVEKLGSTLKHFPGYGDNGDSHTDIIYDTRTLEELTSYDFQPFLAGIKAGADRILVSHNIVPAIDDVPSSISPKINQILRDNLGFQGVIMTDDMDMAGLADFISQEEAAYRVLMAGNDMIMSSQYATQIPYLLAKVDSGELTEERLNQSVRRILQWKYKLGLFEQQN